MRLDMKKRVVETKADLDNIKEEDEETPNMQRVEIHKQPAWQRGSTTSWTRPWRRST